MNPEPAAVDTEAEALAHAEASAVDPHVGHAYTTDKAAYQRRLKRIEGQVRGIARMVDEDKYCIDILTQVAAVNKALHAVSIGLLEDHISHCVVGAAKESEASADPAIVQEKVKEATDAIGRLLR
ncbi:metal-sensitive transcriptional regulator [Arthrobacter crystallopoietes]|uniref:metal-sensitive transcriptional regulator n=1 Tax=Micrococcaceae TaxID=1268 RepID=UPI0021CAA518|nr:metal-sensitive transcriptional regulator [Arthrobacter sp. Marseille-P9274]